MAWKNEESAALKAILEGTARVTGEHFFQALVKNLAKVRRKTYYTLILRNVNDRVQAEQKIQSLLEETEHLRQEIEALQNFRSLQRTPPF